MQLQLSFGSESVCFWFFFFCGPQLWDTVWIRKKSCVKLN